MKMLIVDDSLIVRRKIEREISCPEIGEIYATRDGQEAVDLFKSHRPDIVTMDLTMPKMDGTECVKQLVSIDPNVVILVISALSDKATAIKAIKYGAYGFLCKPFTEQDLNEALDKCIAFCKEVRG